MSRRTAYERWVLRFSCVFTALILTTGTVLAHGGSLRANQQELAIPTWLFLMTGGGAIGGSFLLASFVTDRQFIRSLHDIHRLFDVPATRIIELAMRALGVVGLFVVIVFGFIGPIDPLLNLAVLLVWGGWWSGYTITTYLVGNSWPVLNPWRTLASVLPSLGLSYPDGWGAWPSVVGLLGLIWLEVVSPLADQPRLLAGVVLAYTVATLAGAVAFGVGYVVRAG